MICDVNSRFDVLIRTQEDPHFCQIGFLSRAEMRSLTTSTLHQAIMDSWHVLIPASSSPSPGDLMRGPSLAASSWIFCHGPKWLIPPALALGFCSWALDHCLCTIYMCSANIHSPSHSSLSCTPSLAGIYFRLPLTSVGHVTCYGQWHISKRYKQRFEMCLLGLAPASRTPANASRQLLLLQANTLERDAGS